MPVYKQIRRCIAERIERGDYPTGSMIPSENELAEEFGTTRLTIRSAMDELVKSGQIRRVQGKGAFVGHKWFDEHARKGGFRQSVLASGATPSVRILARSKRYAGPYYADLFGIGEDDLLYSVRRLNCIDGEPVSIEMTLIRVCCSLASKTWTYRFSACMRPMTCWAESQINRLRSSILRRWAHAMRVCSILSRATWPRAGMPDL